MLKVGISIFKGRACGSIGVAETVRSSWRRGLLTSLSSYQSSSSHRLAGRAEKGSNQ